MRIGKLILALLMFLASTTVNANEVAMVTEIQGQCTVTSEGETNDLELAEMLTVGSKVKVEATSFLKLLHLEEDKEYKITENTIVEIGEKTINGSNTGKEVKLAYVDANLGETATQQAGSTDAARLINKVSQEIGNEAFTPKDSQPIISNSDLTDSTEQVPAASEVTVADTKFGKTMEKEVVKPSRFTRAPRAPKAPSARSKKTTKNKIALSSQKKKSNYKIFFALPSSLYLAIQKNKKGYSVSLPKEVTNFQLSSRKHGDKWLIFSIVCSSEIKDKELYIDISSNNKVYKIKLSKQLNENVISALRLEQNNQWGQAAAIWIKLLSNTDVKANNKSIENRLNYLKQKINENAM